MSSRAHRSRRACHIAGRLFVLLLAGSLAQAAEYTRQEVDSLHHWAYSAAFGTGVYRVGDEKVFVFRFSPTIPIAEIPEWKSKFSLRLPFTFGFQDLDADIEDVSDSLTTFSFVPGVEWQYQAAESWQLKPYVHYGWGRESERSESAKILYGGINSRYAFFKNDLWQMDLLNGLQWFRYSTDTGNEDHFARLVTGVEASYRLKDWTVRGYPVYLKPHILHFWYFNELGFSQITEAPVELKQELELGFAIGANKPIGLPFLKFDRFGVGYRFGTDSEGVRFFVSSSFD